MSILSPSFDHNEDEDEDDYEDDDDDDDPPSASAGWHVGYPQRPRNVGLLLGQTLNCVAKCYDDDVPPENIALCVTDHRKLGPTRWVKHCQGQLGLIVIHQGAGHNALHCNGCNEAPSEEHPMLDGVPGKCRWLRYPPAEKKNIGWKEKGAILNNFG